MQQREFEDMLEAHPTKSKVIEKAQTYFYHFLELSLKNNIKFTQPHISSLLHEYDGADWYVEFEWWVGDKKLCIFFDDEEIFYIRVFDKIKPIEDGDIKSLDMCKNLLIWIQE